MKNSHSIYRSTGILSMEVSMNKRPVAYDTLADE